MPVPVFAVTGRGNEAKRARDLIATIGGSVTTKDHEANYLVVVKGAGRRKVEDYCRIHHNKANANGDSAAGGRLLLLDMLEDWSSHGRAPQRTISVADIQMLNLFSGNGDDVAGRRSYAVPEGFLKRSRLTVDAEGLLVDESDNAVILSARRPATAGREKEKKGPRGKEEGSVVIAHRPLLLDSESPPQQRVRQGHMDPVHLSVAAPRAARPMGVNPMREAFRQRPKPEWDTFFTDPAPVAEGGGGSDRLGFTFPPQTAALPLSNRESSNRMHSIPRSSAAMVTKSKKNGLEMTFDFSKNNAPSQLKPSLCRVKNEIAAPTHQSGTNKSNANTRDKTDAHPSGSGRSNNGEIKSMEKKSEVTRRPHVPHLSTTTASTSTAIPAKTTTATTTTATGAPAVTFAVPQKLPLSSGRDRKSHHQPTVQNRSSTVRPTTSLTGTATAAPVTTTTTTTTTTTATTATTAITSSSNGGTLATRTAVPKTAAGRTTATVGSSSHAPTSRHTISTANGHAASTTTAHTSSSGASRRPAQSHGDSLDPLLKRIRQSVYCKGISEEACVTILQQIVDRACPVSFDGIAGLEVCKRILKEAIILPAKCPQLFTGLRRPCSGLLLFGPPGNGKTLLAKAVACECDTTFFSISAAAITSKWVGESEKMVRALFAVARALAPSTIFVDEIDALLQARGGQNEGEGSRRLKTEFLVQMDGAGNDNHEARVLVMGATNRPFDLDEAIIRRFPKRVFVPLPDAPARAQILKSLLNTDETPNNFTPAVWDRIAEATEKYSGHDLRQLCEELAMLPVRALLEDKLRKGEDLATEVHRDSLRPLTLQDVEGCVRARKPSCCLRQLQALDEWNNTYGSR